MKRILTGAAALRREDRLQKREDRLSIKNADLKAEVERLRKELIDVVAVLSAEVDFIATLTAENERLTNTATNLLSALNEYRTFKPDEDCDGWEDERMRIFETLNMTEAELIAALQPKEGNQ